MAHPAGRISASLLALLVCVGCCSPSYGGRESFTLHESGGAIEVELAAAPAGVSRAQLTQWIAAAARAVGTYYARFPVKRVTLSVSADAAGHEIHGRTYGGRRIKVDLGPDVTPAELNDDWILTHEMFHLAFPELGDAHEWMNEGLSTYQEPIARVRTGAVPAERVWREMVEGMPDGLPEAGDEGLDRTHTWGRTYWGGCLFWLLADVRIREQTKRGRSLQDALRAILDAGGDGSVQWDVNRVLDVGDRATGTSVLTDLYHEMAQKPVRTDLDALWKTLGVAVRGKRVTFDDTAPLGAIRREIAGAREVK